MVAFRTLAVSALFALPAVLAEPLGIPTTLNARQLSGFDPSKFPTSCLQQQCMAVVNKVSDGSCTTLQCLCTNDLVTAMKSCLQCAVTAGVYNSTVADDAVSGFVSGCAAAGFTVSGGSATATTGTGSSGSGSSAGAAATGSGGSTTGGSTTKSGAVIGISMSVVGSIAALALGGITLA